MATPRSRTRLRRFSYGLLWIMTVGLALFTGWRWFGGDLNWPIVMALSFTPYVAAAAAVPIVLALWLRAVRLLTLVVVCACALTVLLIPRILDDRDPAADGPKLRVMTVNVLTGEAVLDDVAELVADHDIDILAVQELTTEAVDLLADTGIDTRLPHQLLKPAAKAAGTGIYSRHELTENPDLAPDGLFHSPAATLDVPGYGEVEFLAVHPAPPVNPSRTDNWRDDLRALPKAPTEGPPRILAGDFNSTLDHKTLRELIDTGYTDAGAATGNGLAGTWPADRTFFPKVTIDHILSSRGVTASDYAVHTIPGSDHRSLTTTLTLPAEDD